MLFYEESVLADAGDCVLVIGTDIPELEADLIDTLVIPVYEDLSTVEKIMTSFEIGTVYIPDNDELYEICSAYDVLTVRVNGSMSFGVGEASVSVTSGQNTPSLITRITMGEDRLLICGNMDEQRLEELKNIDTGSFGYINLTANQKDISKEIISTYTPHTLVFTGTEPYIEGYNIAKESIILEE